MTKLSKYLNPLTSERSIPKNKEEFKDNARSQINTNQHTPYSNA